MKAVYNGIIIAEFDATIVVENNHYFPLESLDHAYFKETDTTTVCGWKGTANYYSVVVGKDVNEDAAWYYKEPKPAAAEIKQCCILERCAGGWLRF